MKKAVLFLTSVVLVSAGGVLPAYPQGNYPVQPQCINQHQRMRNRQSLMRQHQSLMLLLRLYITHLLQWCIMPRLPWLMRLQVLMGDTGILVHTEDMEDTDVIPCLAP